MKSSELGRLFEAATRDVLEKMFKCWGYDVLDTKVQKSGTQHGFDVHYKLARQQTRLNVFVECKASESCNRIAASELTEKVAQLDWGGFPEKDVHLFLSPSRAIDWDNTQLTIEDNDRPFVIMDWMRKDGRVGPVLELFAAAPEITADADAQAYCDFLLTEVFPGFRPSRTFAEVCGDLKREFDRRIAEHSARAKAEDYRIINGAYWSQAQSETHFEFLHYYYTKTDSTPARLREVVANDYHVRNEKLDKEFERTLRQAVKDRAALVKVLSKGGEGKSTFLWHIAKTYHESHRVVWLEGVDAGLPAEIEKQRRRLDADRPVLFLLDNPAAYGQALTEFAQKLVTIFRRQSIVLVVAEREFRYLNIEDTQDFEAIFNQTYAIAYRAAGIREEIVERLIVHLEKESRFSEEVRAGARAAFLEDRRKSLAECTFSVIKYLHSRNELKGYRFDWEDWEQFAREGAPKLQRLYLIVATFYQFGYSLDIKFCAGFLDDADVVDINSALRESVNLPIYRRGQHLLLRHETLASWYLDDENEKLRANRRNSEEIFKAFLNKIDTPFARNLFIWACIKNQDFRKSYLAKLLDDGKRIAILESFIAQHPSELKCRTELSKIYQRQKRWREAEDILLELKRLDPENLQARTELSKIYQRQGRWQEAEDILLELLKLEPDDLQARTELSKIYQRQGRMREAEALLRECLDIDSYDANSLLELGKICARDPERYLDAEQFFQRILQVDTDNVHAKIELAALYRNMKRYPAREQLLLEIYEAHPDDIPTLMALAHVFIRFRKYRVAMRLLEYALGLRKNDLLTITEIIRVCEIMHDHEQVNEYVSRGETILREDPLNKHAERFSRLDVRLDEEISLQSLNEVGIAIVEDGQRYVESQGVRYPVNEQAVVNNQIEPNDKVFFAVYARGQDVYADFIEPYFESIDDLERLR